MKLPRFTVRRLMVAVAIVGGLLGSGLWLGNRSLAFRRIADQHAAELWWFYTPPGVDPGPPGINSARDQWHADMMYKYRRAARYPWLPVAPDPPEP
jgi:hypothetical protein